MPAELAIERGPGTPASAASKRAICSRVSVAVDLVGAREVRDPALEAPRGCRASAARRRGIASSGKPRRCMPLSSLNHTAMLDSLGIASRMSTCQKSCTTTCRPLVGGQRRLVGRDHAFQQRRPACARAPRAAPAPLPCTPPPAGPPCPLRARAPPAPRRARRRRPSPPPSPSTAARSVAHARGCGGGPTRPTVAVTRGIMARRLRACRARGSRSACTAPRNARLDRAGRAVALLGDDDLGDALLGASPGCRPRRGR